MTTWSGSDSRGLHDGVVCINIKLSWGRNYSENGSEQDGTRVSAVEEDQDRVETVAQNSVEEAEEGGISLYLSKIEPPVEISLRV